MADDGKEKKGCCEKLGDGFSNFAKFLFNKETGQVMGRSGESWLKIGVFYLIFYGFLAAFFSAMLTVFLSTLNDPETGGAPKLVQFIENKPGLTVMKKFSLNKFKEKNPSDEEKGEYKDYVKEIFGRYNGTSCEDNKDGMPEGSKCVFNTALLGDTCGPNGESTNYGLDGLGGKADKPEQCVYVRINKVYGWVPTPSKGTQDKYLKLKCDAEAEAVEIIPEGFHIGSFPFRGQQNFELPIVAVKIKDKSLSKVVCYLDGPNIEVSESSVAHRAFAKVEIS